MAAFDESKMQFCPIRLKKHPQWCIGLEHATADNMVNVCLNKYTGQDHQLWCMDQFGCIRTRLNIKYGMDVEGHCKQGQNVILFEIHGGYNQQFKVAGNTIQCKHATNLCFDLAGGAVKEKQTILAWGRHGGWNQEFIFDKSKTVIGSARAAASKAKQRTKQDDAKKQAAAAKRREYANKNTLDKLFERLPQTSDYFAYKEAMKREGVKWNELQNLADFPWSHFGVYQDYHKKKITNEVADLTKHLQKLGLDH